MNFSKIYGQIDKNFTLDDLQWLALYLLTIAYKDFDIISQSSLLDYFSHLSQIPISNNDSMIWIQHYIYLTVATAQCNLKIDNTFALQKVEETNYIVRQLT